MAFDGQIRGGDFDLDDLTVDFFKANYLVGIQINGVSDDFYSWWLGTSAEVVAHETGVAVYDEVVSDEPHDYNASDWVHYNFLKLNRFPVKSINRVDAIYPTGNFLFSFPTEWLRCDRNGAQIQIVPSGGSLAQVLLGRGGIYVPFIRNLSYLPQLFHVYYTAGWQDGKVPRRLIDAVCKKTAINVLAQIGDLIYGPGVVSRSLSVDGLSQSESFVNNGQDVAIFTGRISRYLKDLYGDPQLLPDQDGLIMQIKKEHRGFTFVSL